MRYNISKFNSAVSGYRKELGNSVKGKNILVHFKIPDESAFYSLAPLSRAVHELGGNLNVSLTTGKNMRVEVLKGVWNVYENYKNGANDGKVKAMMEFVNAVNKKAGSKEFVRIFRPPEIVLVAGKNFFCDENGSIELKYRAEWFRKYRWKDLLQTSKAIWKNSYALKKNEIASIGFELIPAKRHLDSPLQDYLDNFAIAYAMMV